MKVLINYANDAYRKAQRLNSWTGRHIAGFDRVYAFTPEDIDRAYYEAHQDIFAFSRGNGLWLWKPYFIDRVLSECADGDIVFYADSGAFFVRPVDALLHSLREGEKIWVSDNPTLESCFTKPLCFEKMDCDQPEIRNSNQIQGTYCMFVCCDETRAFVKEWLRNCETYDLICPAGGQALAEKRGSGFVAHREDQSILSLLCKKHGVRAHRDPSQRGKYPETFYNENYTYRVPEHPDDTYRTVLFLHKSPTASLIDIAKMRIKSRITVYRLRKKGL